MGMGAGSGFACGYAGIVYRANGAVYKKRPAFPRGLKCNKTVLR